MQFIATYSYAWLKTREGIKWNAESPFHFQGGGVKSGVFSDSFQVKSYSDFTGFNRILMN